MFLFGIFCLQVLALNQIAVEFRETPLTRTGKDLKNVSETIFHKERSFSIENNEVKVFSKISPSNSYGFHMYLEEDFQLRELPFIKKDNDSLFISSLDSPVDDTSLISLYFQSILPKSESGDSNVYLNVSSKDYYNEKQCMKLASIFSQLGYITKTIPESMAACIFNCKNIETNGIRYQYFLNLNGSKSVSSLYKIEKDDKSISISLEKSQIEKEIPSNYEIEDEIYKYIKSKINYEDPIALLPYENLENKSKYVDFKPIVNEFIQKYNGGISEYVILEIDVYDVQNNKRERPIIETKIVIKDFLPFIQEKFSKTQTLKYFCDKNKIESAEDKWESFLISNIKPPVSFMESSESKWADQRIIEGVFLSHDTKYKLKDSRIQRKASKLSDTFRNISYELDTKREVLKSILPNINIKLSSFKNLLSQEKESFEVLIKNSNLEKLKDLELIKNEFEQLMKLDVKKYIEMTEKPKALKNFQELFNEADILCSQLGQLPEEKTKFVDFLVKTRQWFDEQALTSEMDALNKQLRWLQAYVKVTREKLNNFIEKQKSLNEANGEVEKDVQSEEKKRVDGEIPEEHENRQVEDENKQKETPNEHDVSKEQLL